MSILKALLSGSSIMTIVARAPEGAGNITMADLVGYFNMYKAKYSADCTLSVDVMEELLGNAKDDDALLEAMHETMTSSDDEDVIGRDVVERDERPGSAYSYAIKLDPQFEKDIEVLAQAAIDNKRGGAVIMLDLFRIFGEETICETWPVPGMWKHGDGGSKVPHAGDNEAWDKEETTVLKADGTSGKGTKSFYVDIVALSARGDVLLKEREAIKKIVGDVKATKTRLSAIDGKISNFKSALIRAVNLAKKMAFVNNHTEMSAELIYDEDGKTVVQSNKLVFVKNTKDASKFDIITIGQFLALKVSEGATYSAIVGTTQRQPKAGTGPVSQEVNVNSVDDFDKVTAAYATFFDKLNEALGRKDAKAYNALLTRLNAAGSDDLLLSMNTIMNSIEGILSKPGIDKRLGALIADGGKAKAA